MNFSPGDFVVLYGHAVELLFSNFWLTAAPEGPGSSHVVGSFSDGDLGFVLDVAGGRSRFDNEFVLLLTPSGVGWLSAYYLDAIEGEP